VKLLAGRSAGSEANPEEFQGVLFFLQTPTEEVARSASLAGTPSADEAAGESAENAGAVFGEQATRTSDLAR
jgi:hypothetical protein